MTQISDQLLFTILKAGQYLGHSQWITVTQNMIDQFGAVTLDPDPMHVDPVWARTHGPFEHTIAFGFLTVSLLTHLIHSTLHTRSGRGPSSEGYYMNYGFDRLRLVAPVPVESRVRGQFKVLEVRQDASERVIVKFGCEIEIEGNSQPALVADWLTIWIPPGTS